MDEIEIVDGVVDAAEAAELGGVESVGREVEANPEIQNMAQAPEVASENQSALRTWINSSTTGEKLWTLSKFLGKNVAGASLAFGIFYGLNKAAAKNAAADGKRTKLSDYIPAAKANWLKIMGVAMTDDQLQATAAAALTFAWIDASE